MQKEHEIRVFPFPDDKCKYHGRPVVEKSAQILADNLKVNGLIQAGKVALDGDGKYLIIAGNTRHRACQIAGIDFRAEVLPEMPSRRDIIRMQWAENSQRRNLTAYERCDYIMAFKAEMPPQATWEELAEAMGIKPTTILLHAAPRRIPEPLRPSTEGIGLTILCLIARTPKLGDMPKVIEFARAGATKAQVESFIRGLARTVGRRPAWIEWTVNGRTYRIEVRDGVNGSHLLSDIEAINKALARYKDAPADGLGFLFPPPRGR